MKIILCGYNWPGCKALELLTLQGHEIFVFTHDNPYHVCSLIDMCRKIDVPFSTENISRVDLPFIPDVICSVYYRNLIKRHVIKACKGRIFNLHPSLLPKYRGCSSLTWALINGEEFTGFSYHYIDEGCDTGPVLLQRRMRIEAWDTQETLYHRVMFAAMQEFVQALEMVNTGHEGAQQVGESSYYPRGCPYGGVIDPAWDEAKIERFIRAMIYPPYPPASYKGKKIRTMREFKDVLFE